MAFLLNEVEMLGTDEACLWFVRGIDNRLYPTKIVAEAAARRFFGNEDEITRYARITCKTFDLANFELPPEER